MKPYYKVCPICGAHLDPSERCDCADTKGSEAIVTIRPGNDRLRNDTQDHTPDGLGGFTTAWTEDTTPFKAAITFDNSIEARVAEQQGVHSLYTVTTRKDKTLMFHDVIKRLSDGKVLRITSDGDDSATPPSATLNMRQCTAEEWTLPG